MKSPEKTYLTWQNIQDDCETLANNLRSEQFTCIIGVANGGMIPATLLAKKLKVNKLLSANLKSYQEDKPRDGAHTNDDVVKVISFPSWEELKNEKVLVVDDLADTGLTLRKIKQISINWEKENQGGYWTYATLYFKPNSQFLPKNIVRVFDKDEWIVFPWEH